MKLKYISCPLCEDGSISLFEGDPQLSKVQKTILYNYPAIVEILKRAATNANTTISEMISSSRRAADVRGRHEAMVALQNECGLGPAVIGAILKRDHSNIIVDMGDEYQTRYFARQ